MEHGTTTVLAPWLPQEGVKILLVLVLSFLIGLEREEHKTPDQYGFGGVRTFPLIGLIGYGAALLSGPQGVPVAVGFAVVGGFLWLSYRHKLTASAEAGVTTEMSGLAVYLIGALVYHDWLWVAITLSVVSTLLLEFKQALEGLARRAAPDEILNVTKFLLLTGVILPLLPNRAFGPIGINPFKTWLVVVAVSGVSYGSYILQKVTRGRGGILLAAILGGAYSSTVTTVALARRSAAAKRPHAFSGAVLVASGMMYIRLAVLVGLFNHSIFMELGVPFMVLACLAVLAGWLWTRLPDPDAAAPGQHEPPSNPLELRAAFLFAVIFVAMLAVTHFALAYLGSAGLYTLAAVMGVSDVDPFIMSLTQSAGAGALLHTATSAILIAAASNNLIKGIYAFSMADRQTGRLSLCALVLLAALGLVPLLWLAR